jgi:glutaredoxin 3
MPAPADLDREDRSTTMTSDTVRIVVYTTALCPYCHMAKALLARKQAPFEEIDVTGRADLRAAMREAAGGVGTVPQIWIGERHVGGCMDLYALDRTGALDPLLAPPSTTPPTRQSR